MSLNKEWNKRISNWLAELERQFYHPMGTVDLEGCTVFDRLSPEAAAALTFKPFPAGTAWGAKWEYGWFRGRLKLPHEAAGRRIVLRLNPGLEGVVFINGRAAGARDREHREISLANPAKGGESFDILAEFYAGHGHIEENIGPVPPGRLPIPPTQAQQRTVEESTWGLWDDDAFNLWIDAETLYQTRQVLPETSLRVSRIDAALKEFTRVADFEQDPESMRASFRAARAVLRPMLECVNGSTAPTMFVFGNSHLDLAWQWPQEETVHKAARTMSTQLALLDEYPEYRFFWCQVPLFEYLRDDYPEIWQRVKTQLASGRIIADGGMWLEPDTNLPGGEALIRQVMLAKAFFRDELGQDTTALWLPDTFGFSAALPQIMRGTGLKYFFTKKLIDNYNDGDPFPLVTFRWRGLDGSEVPAHVYRKSNSVIDPKTLAKRWNIDRAQKDNIDTYLFPIGYGDGGGGPTRAMLEFTRRLGDLEGNPRTRWSNPADFFEDRLKRGPIEEEYQGELYFQEHRGTYTTQARTKRANRRAEIALREAEFWTAAASALAGLQVPAKDLSQLWRGLLFNHFHDIISGASIARVHAEAEAQLEAIRVQAGNLAEKAITTLARPQDDKTGFTAFNSLSWERNALCRLPAGTNGLSDADGRPLPIQRDADGTWAILRLPSAGWTGFKQTGSTETTPDTACELSIQDTGQGFRLENRYLQVLIDQTGRITSMVDRMNGLELAAAPCNEFRLYQDVTTHYDAWDIDTMYRSLPVHLEPQDTSLEIIATGPLFVALRLRKKIRNSFLEQEIRLERDSRRIEFRAVIDWREDHKLLKVDFPTRLRADDALYEIQFGHVRRPTHRNRRYDADRYEGCHHKWVALAEARRGAAVLNDCKYGSSVSGGTISLTLLKAPWVPDMGADRGRQVFSYAFLAWNGDFPANWPVREAYEFNYPPSLLPGQSPKRSLLEIDEPSVMLECLKPAEDGSGDLIMRLYEASGGAVRASLSLDIACSQAGLCDMLENRIQPLALQGNRLELVFGAFEIKTVRLAVKR